MTMPREVKLPTYEPLLIEAIRNLAVDSGIVSAPVYIGSNALIDTTKNWPNGIHKNRLLKIVGSAASGAGQMAIIDNNTSNTLIIKGKWSKAIGSGAGYVILNADFMQMLRDVLNAGENISAAHPLEVHDPTIEDVEGKIDDIETKLDGASGLAAIKAVVDAILVDTDTTLEDKLDALALICTEARLAELDAANIPTDIDGLKTSRDSQLFTMDFWSLPQERVTIPAAPAADQPLPSVTVGDLPGDATIVRAIAMFKFRMVQNSNIGANALAGAQEIQIAGDVDAINFVDDMFTIAAETREGGDVIIGVIDIATTVTANGAYAFHWDLAVADVASLIFNDVQMGIRIWYSV